MTPGLVRVDSSEPAITQLVLDDPERRNALSYELVDELLDAFTTAEKDQSVRCIVLASSHPTTFSAGGNLSKMASDASPMDQFEASVAYRKLLLAIVGSHKPVICAASGHVLAGAIGVALACDLVVASEHATFGTPEINVGVFPFQVMALLYRNLPRKVATELLLLGERMSAKEALRLGLINRVVPSDAFAATVGEMARALASKSPLLMSMGKEAMARQTDMRLEESLDYLHHRLVLALTTEDIREGVDAFFAKREPVWKGR